MFQRSISSGPDRLRGAIDPRDERSEPMSVAITEEVESKALNHRDADVDEDEDYKK